MRSHFLEESVDITRHTNLNVSLFSVNVNIHSKVLGAEPIYFYLIKFSESSDEMVDAVLFSPTNCEIVNDQGESY